MYISNAIPFFSRLPGPKHGRALRSHRLQALLEILWIDRLGGMEMKGGETSIMQCR